MMHYEITQLARTPLLLLDYAVEKGMDRAMLMEAAGLSADDIAKPDSRIKTSHNLKLWRTVIDHQNDALLGVHVGSSIRATALGLVGYAMYHSRDLRSALQRLALYMRILSEAIIFRIDERGEQTVVTWQAHPSLVALRHPIEMGVTTVVSLAREITGSDLVPIQVDLPASRLASLSAYQSVFRCPVLFNRPVAAVTFSRQQMALPAKATDVTLTGYLDELAAKTMAPLVERDKNMTTTVRRALWPVLPGGRPDLSRIASHIGVSDRTLQRRLEEEGSSFSHVLDDLRRDLSEELLVDRKLSVAEASFLLGYSEPSAFQRAFRRWRGISPRRFHAG